MVQQLPNYRRLLDEPHQRQRVLMAREKFAFAKDRAKIKLEKKKETGAVDGIGPSTAGTAERKKTQTCGFAGEEFVVSARN